MIIWVSTNVPLNADHGVLFGIFIRVFVLSTFWIWKVNGMFYSLKFFPSSLSEMRFFLLFNMNEKKFKSLILFLFFFSSSDIRNRSRKSVKQKIKKLWPYCPCCHCHDSATKMNIDFTFK